MRALRRSFAVLIWTAIAWLGTACDQPIEPTKEPTDVGPSFAVGGPTCNVPTDYLTIQAAVNDAGCTTIDVAPGPYLESVTIPRPVILLGPNAGTPWNGGRGAEAFVTSAVTTFNVTSQDVTIAGFTITGDFGIYVSGSTTNTLIQNNITTGVTRALTLDAPGSNASVLGNHLVSPVRSLHVSGGPYTNMAINGNRFSGAAATGIFFSGALSNSITGFEFEDNEVLHLANLASNITNGTLTGNTFNAPPGSGLDIQASLHNSTVTDNTFEGNDNNACFQLFGSQFGLVPSHHVTISDNTFSDCGEPTAPTNYAIQLSPDIHHIYITNNQISDGNEGVNTRDASLWNVTGLEIHINLNNITNNTTFGVRNGQIGILDAECNWWGAADGPGPVGPGSGDNVSTNVDYAPWLVAPAPGGPCAGGAPSGKVTGGGQINVTGGKASFGFNAKSDAGVGSGHLNYLNHASGAHLDCTVDFVTVLTATTAEFEGGCSPNSSATYFKAHVEDNGKSGKNDVFRITYNLMTDGIGTLRSGNIQIHQ